MRKLSIQIVDDDPDLAESLAEFVELGGHRVLRAHSADEALSQFQEHAFDLVFMDIRMPGMDGVDALARMKALRPHTEVIMMTGYTVQDRIDAALSTGARQVLQKPLNLTLIKSILQNQSDRRLILIIDDDADFVESVCEVLLHQGHAIATAPDGHEGLRQIVDKEPNKVAANAISAISAIILDLRMEKMGGVAVLEALEDLELTLPIIIVSAYMDEEGGALASLDKTAFAAVLEKPVNPDELLQAIRSAGDTLQ